MDNGRGYFDQVEPSHFREMMEAAANGTHDGRLDKIFFEGEQVQVKSSKFIVRSIDHLTGIMTLKLLPEKKNAV
jgi:hypothetical protein